MSVVACLLTSRMAACGEVSERLRTCRRWEGETEMAVDDVFGKLASGGAWRHEDG